MARPVPPRLPGAPHHPTPSRQHHPGVTLVARGDARRPLLRISYECGRRSPMWTKIAGGSGARTHLRFASTFAIPLHLGERRPHSRGSAAITNLGDGRRRRRVQPTTTLPSGRDEAAHHPVGGLLDRAERATFLDRCRGLGRSAPMSWSIGADVSGGQSVPNSIAASSSARASASTFGFDAICCAPPGSSWPTRSVCALPSPPRAA